MSLRSSSRNANFFVNSLQLPKTSDRRTRRTLPSSRMSSRHLPTQDPDSITSWSCWCRGRPKDGSPRSLRCCPRRTLHASVGRSNASLKVTAVSSCGVAFNAQLSRLNNFYGALLFAPLDPPRLHFVTAHPQSHVRRSRLY